MTVCVTIRVIPPRWGRAYLKMMLALARAGVAIDEDAAVERVHRETRIEVSGPG